MRGFGAGYRRRVSIASAWEDHAAEWIAWARTSTYDPFQDVTWPALRDLLPEPGTGPVIDLGCGEGRDGRELLALGHQVVGVDRSPTLAAAATAPGFPVLLADAAALPLADESAGLVVACMSLLDVDDFDGAVSEIGRVLRPGGALCMAVIHPFISGQDGGSIYGKTFRFAAPYLESRQTVDHVDRDGLTMTFTSMHRPLSAYTSALFASGMMITAITEAGDGMVPWLLALRADKIRG